MNRSWKSDLCNDSTVASEPKVRLKRKKEEVGCVEDKQRMDAVKEKAIEAIMRYCDSLYFKENTIEEKLNGIQGPRVPSKYEFESLIGFIEMVSEREIIDEYKELVKNHFGRMVQWFHKDYMEGEERPIPARINGVKVSLLDLYLTVKGLGGHTQVIMKNNWIEVAYAMGFPKEYASELEECYGTHLSLLGAYYEGARNYSSGMDVPKAREREGTSGKMAMELPSEGYTSDESDGTDNKPRRNGDKSQINCYKCGKLGHYAYECPSKKKEEVEALLVENDDEPALLMCLIDEN
ncbi:zinc finger, CCHC-type containing protein [Tanacetum coccineum]|uniref:Zinc finger, CCHC-type containing protein n=1 Tax=Tanacetum coccineum TaxID=301880 RepID=A0ABQ4XDS4_9ASTR